MEKNRDAMRVLKDIFGFDAFRPDQQDIVAAILEKRDAFVVMPTGGGKSLCYQLPAHMMTGTCLVVSPLISLMKDQVDAAQEIGLRAAYLNSSMTGVEQTRVSRSLALNELDLIYVSPERFAMDHFLMLLEQVKVSFVAIDEAHCISEWGHDFRPDYLNLSQIIKRFPDVHLTAFTATATRRVQEDIIERLGLRTPHVVRASFNRPNLFYRVIPKDAPAQQILSFVQSHSGDSGIIYRTTRKSVESTAKDLKKHGIKALPYHAGLSAEERAENQEAFNRDEVDVVVATIAFGMGIDKSNVRYVLHADLPKNIESYYQETGRAGRDGEPAECLLLFGRGDIPKLRFFIDQMESESEQKHALNCLNQMAGYASLNVCRRKQLLGYFQEDYPLHNCSACDICADEAERVDATQDAQIVMSAIVRTGERFGITHVVDVVAGANTERIRKLEHDKLKTYGAGRNREKRYWRGIIDNLLAQALVGQSDEQYPTLHLMQAAAAVLYEGKPFYVLRQKEAGKTKKHRALEFEYDQPLFEELRVLRKRLADDQNVPPYAIYSDRTLHEMACELPTTTEQMLRISGVGRIKNERYGELFGECIEQYRKEHPEVVPREVHTVVKRKQKSKKKRMPKGQAHEETLRLLEQGLSLHDIAIHRELTLATIVNHLEKSAANGQTVPFEVEQYVAPAKRLLIEELFSQHGRERLAPVVTASNGLVTYDDVRLVRLWAAMGE